MKTYVAAIVLLLSLTACATKQAGENEPPSLVPPADVAVPTNPATEARLVELQTSMTELLERMDVLNARIARLESSAQNEPRLVQTPARAVEPAPVPHAIEPAPAVVPAPAPVPGIGQRPAPISRDRRQLPRRAHSLRQRADGRRARGSPAGLRCRSGRRARRQRPLLDRRDVLRRRRLDRKSVV